MISWDEFLERYDEIFKKLTPRERQILQLMAREGLSHKQIGDRLGISWRTVASHMTSIYDKLCGYRRALIVAIIEAWRRGEINL